jgi:23S rRNA (cytosine1962-C5)-methyltransferase
MFFIVPKRLRFVPKRSLVDTGGMVLASATCANLRAIFSVPTFPLLKGSPMTDSIFPRLVLTKGREKSLLRRHPWIFSGAVARMEGKARSGETIDIVDSQGKWLARGAYSPSSQIRARVWSFDRNEAIDNAFFERRLQQAQTWREWLAARDGLDSYRLIAGESDGLPGVTIDRFGDFFVLQLLSAGAEYQRASIVSALQTLFPNCAIYDRSDVAVRKKEGWSWRRGRLSANCRLPCCRLPSTVCSCW